ncbi:hypothetical protein [Streptococcus sanguinis]|jgi:hypothetical protein|uniref:hypothetical protein n=1 Tax=Streptococcus sanguinis TaxID=1305 RepID=UPI000F67052C|nr:hypothetical protein [Streptococcus sanguinis]RSJ40273.1 hypothetical protein D8820_05435 [Streptococcus sanguinis]
MADKISIDLTQQEQLLLHIRTMVTSATQLSTKLKEGVDGLPALTSKGEVHNRMVGNENQLIRFVTKAQTFQTLTEVIFKHTQTTYSEFIDTDKILAMDIANSILYSSEASAEDKQGIKDDPKGSVDKLKKSIQDENGEIHKNMKGTKSSDIIIGTGGA